MRDPDLIHDKESFPSISSQKYSLFSCYGIEAEYMIVGLDDLKVSSYADHLLTFLNDGVLTEECELGEVAASNELVNHVIEIKGNGPKKDLIQLEQDFYQVILKINNFLLSSQLKLLPTAMHPTMLPENETYLWEHGHNEIYELYNKIFNCKGHGWSNLQSVHLNLPFNSEEDFIFLYNTTRLVTALVPHFAASSPIAESKLQETPDFRIRCYEKNQQRIPIITGSVIPDAISSFRDYEELLEEIYSAVSPHDPNKILQKTWLNSRGAIPKFPNQVIEIRVMDIQESPLMDFGLLHFFIEILKRHHDALRNHLTVVPTPKTSELKSFFDKAHSWNFRTEKLSYQDITLLSQILCFDLTTESIQLRLREEMNFSEFMQLFLDSTNFLKKIPSRYHDSLKLIIGSGSLSYRMKSFYRKHEKNQQHDIIEKLYNRLSECLYENKMFIP